MFSFVISLAAFSVIIGLYGKGKPYLFLFFMGYFCLVVGLLFGNLEAILFPKMFNLLEHIFKIMLPQSFSQKQLMECQK